MDARVDLRPTGSGRDVGGVRQRCGVDRARVAAAYSDGSAYHLAVGPTGDVREVTLPTPVAVRGDSTVTVAAHAQALLLLTDDGSGAHVWLAEIGRASCRERV